MALSELAAANSAMRSSKLPILARSIFGSAGEPVEVALRWSSGANTEQHEGPFTETLHALGSRAADKPKPIRHKFLD